MNSLLFMKLALVNVKKHAKLYFPYIISAAFTSAMFYVMCEITFNEGITKMYGASYLKTVLGMGDIVIGIFSLIFLLYTNSFLMKQRKKELGLYNVLGMEKKHISGIMVFETLIVACISIVSGLLIGMLFDKLVTLFLCKLLNSKVDLGFSLSPYAILLTAGLMLAIFFISFISNVVRIKKSRTIELLHSSSTGEKEPRTKLVLTILGVLFLSAGYIIAVTVESPIEAMRLFFFAVLAVIAGTYCLFVAGSIAVLKVMRKRKNYYYNPKHFTSVSGMLYRMKQNAVGLANICILSTMVLVMVSTTVSLYTGTEDALKSRYPADICVQLGYSQADTEYSAEHSALFEDTVLSGILKEVEKAGFDATDLRYYNFLAFATLRSGDLYTLGADNFSVGSNVNELCFITQKDYNLLTGSEISLGKGEAAVCDYGEKSGDVIRIFGETYTVRERFESFPDMSHFGAVIQNIHFIVVPDNETLEFIDSKQFEQFGKDKASNITFDVKFDLDGSDEQKSACAESIEKSTRQALKDAGCRASFQVDCRCDYREEFYSTHGSFFFLGIVLGLLFLMITVMIIYYKQISEGYEDKKRFEIMQQVGMSREEVRKTIRNQVLTVFFLPLVAAFVHLAFSFPIISRLLVVFNLTNTAVFAIALVITALVFAAIYSAVYAITARAYYKIVS